VVLAARVFGLGKLARVPGAELMPRLCELAAVRGYKVFLFGASPEVNERAARRLRDTYPGLEIAGRQHGFVLEHEVPELLDRINTSGAQIVFVALGSPRQELWIEKYSRQLKANVFQGVGGTFDVIAGSVKRAPWIFRKANLEWFYRLVSQPQRLLRQTALPKFAFQVLMRKVTG
jgi:N-acetylglucosaminyldiphosphoundecaprenol N-acetyl-beta-D-mannosaminyltransferase